jgi:hypothetical protein
MGELLAKPYNDEALLHALQRVLAPRAQKAGAGS